MYKYQNTTEVEQNVMGIGLVEPNGTIETSRVIENPNFKYIGEVQGGVDAEVAEPTPEVEVTVEQPEIQNETQQVEEIN